jgi:uncharacterized protein (DUF488 family)
MTTRHPGADASRAGPSRSTASRTGSPRAQRAGSGRTIATIGYEGVTPRELTQALGAAKVDLLVDVRAVANSRRPGFSKSALAAKAAEAGIDYLHLRGLGTPADGRAAARAGRHAGMRRIFQAHLRTIEARDGLTSLADLVRSGRRVCLLCLEADPTHCHRAMVAEALQNILPVRVRHLRPARREADA